MVGAGQILSPGNWGNVAPPVGMVGATRILSPGNWGNVAPTQALETPILLARSQPMDVGSLRFLPQLATLKFVAISDPEPVAWCGVYTTHRRWLAVRATSDETLHLRGAIAQTLKRKWMQSPS